MRHQLPLQPENGLNAVPAREYLCLTKAELAEELRVSTRQVELLLSQGKIPEPIRLSGHPRWVLEEIRDWLKSFNNRTA